MGACCASLSRLRVVFSGENSQINAMLECNAL